MENIKISVIIPVYNVEKYIGQCLDSIVNQTYKNLEIIIVNDGSNDNSLEIINRYSQNDRRIKIINLENKGVSFARNIGIKNSEGNYISFVDSDDYLNLNTYEKLVKNLDGEDLIIFNYGRFENSTREIIKEKYVSDDEMQELPEEKRYLYSKINHSCWNKLYKTEYLKRNKFKFLEILYEDAVWKVETMFLTSNIKLIDETFYYYRINRKDSIMELGKKFNKNFYEKQIQAYQIIFQKIDNFIKENKNSIIKGKLIYLIAERESWRAKLDGTINLEELNKPLKLFLTNSLKINLNEKNILVQKINKILKSKDIVKIVGLSYFDKIYWKNGIIDIDFFRKRIKLWIKRKKL